MQLQDARRRVDRERAAVDGEDNAVVVRIVGIDRAELRASQGGLTDGERLIRRHEDRRLHIGVLEIDLDEGGRTG